MKFFATILTALTQKPEGFGRIIRDGNNILKIVEEADLIEEEKTILEINAGVYVFEAAAIVNIIEKAMRKEGKKK